VDVFEAGGLRKYMPYTRITFLISTIAISGIPPLAGFFSKDEILWEAFYGGNYLLWILGLISALFTAFYMFRLYNLLFSGEFRGTEEQRHHLHESPAIMWLPLMVLAFFAMTIGWLNMPIVGYTGFHDFLHSVTAKGHEFANTQHVVEPEMKFTAELILAVISVIVALIGIILARLIYVWVPSMPMRMKESFSGAHELLFKKYSVDEIYQSVFINNYYKVCRMTQWSDDNVIIAGLNGIAEFFMICGLWVRQLQSGIVLHYAMATILGAAFLSVWLLLWF
jgi:NADH-quinone oxidoreductase subunit L